MGPANDGDDGLISGINVTPLVDIVLVLLIIFMLTASIIAAPSIHIDLPKAASGEETEPSIIGVTISAKGILYLNDKEISELELYNYIRQTVSNDPKLQAIIAADKTLPYGRVVRTIDLIKRAGIVKFALNIDSDLTDNLPSMQPESG